MAYEPRSVIDRLFRDRHGKVIIWQTPNVPLWGWVAFSILALIFKRGRPHTGFHILSESAVFTWAYLEIKSGQSLFRRILGALVLADLIVSFFM